MKPKLFLVIIFLLSAQAIAENPFREELQNSAIDDLVTELILLKNRVQALEEQIELEHWKGQIQLSHSHKIEFCLPKNRFNHALNQMRTLMKQLWPSKSEIEIEGELDSYRDITEICTRE